MRNIRIINPTQCQAPNLDFDLSISINEYQIDNIVLILIHYHTRTHRIKNYFLTENNLKTKLFTNNYV